MPTNLTVNNNTFAYPSSGDEPGWGEDATGWAEEVTVVLNSISPTGTIAESTATLLDNTVTEQDVSGLIFSSAQVKSAQVVYVINRDTLEESGQLDVYFNGTSWDVVREFRGDYSGVVLTISASGQVKYTSSNMGFSGTIKFKTGAIVTV